MARAPAAPLNYEITWKRRTKRKGACLCLPEILMELPYFPDCPLQGFFDEKKKWNLKCLGNCSAQFSSVAQSCPILWDPMNCSTPGLPVHHQLLEFTQTHVHWVSDAIQPSHPLLSPSPPTPNPSQNQSLFQWVNSSHEVAKVLEFQLQHQSFQWTPRTDLL